MRAKENIKQNRVWVLLLLVISGLLISNIWIMQNRISDYKEVKVHVVEMEERVDSLVNNELVEGDRSDEISFLRDQYSNYRDFADNDRDSFISIVNLFFVALGVLVTLGSLILVWIFGQTRSEVQENAEKTIQSAVSDIKMESEQTMKNIVNPQMEDFEKKYNELQRLLDAQLFLRKTKVLAIGTPKEVERFSINEYERLTKIVSEVTIKNVEDEQEFLSVFKTDKFDVIVYLMSEFEQSLVVNMIDCFIKENIDLPLIVYAKHRISDDIIMNKINSYPLSTLANYPTTLTSNLISLLHLYSFIKEDKTNDS